MSNDPLYYRVTLQDLREILADFYDTMQSLLNPAKNKITFLDDGTYGRDLIGKILDGEDLGVKGAWRVFFDCLNSCIVPDESGRYFTYHFKNLTFNGRFLHPMTPKGVESYRWDRAGGGRPRYLSECGEVRSWVYAREIGIVPVAFGEHALFMSYLYQRRYGEDEFFTEHKHESQDVQAELLKKEGIAYKSSINSKVSACKGSLNEEEVSSFVKNGYIIEYI
ncbi:TPA: hypothetical protein ACSCYS_003507 [Aeromonas veronii]